MTKKATVLAQISFFRFVEDYDKRHTEALVDAEAYVSNPLNSYLLIKRLTGNAQFILKFMTRFYFISH